MGKVYLKQKELDIISLTPPNECWICNNLFIYVKKDRNGLYISKEYLIKNGFVEHLWQILRRNLYKNDAR